VAPPVARRFPLELLLSQLRLRELPLKLFPQRQLVDRALLPSESSAVDLMSHQRTIQC